VSLRYASLKDIPRHLVPGNVAVPAKKPSKYRSEPVVIDGERYDSRLEARCAGCLDLRWRAGEILWYTRQTPFKLEGGVVYRADFLAALANGGVEVIDATGLLTPTKANKLKQMKARYGIDVVLWTDKK